MADKGTLFYENKTLNLSGKIFSFQGPIVQGILNITPDSFYAQSRIDSLKDVLTTAHRMVDEGASILDIGGQSTRPGAKTIELSEELKRVIPVIQLISKEIPEVIISIDTFRSEVAYEAVKAGANIVNDVSGGSLDSNMFKTVAELGVPYILMHSRGDSSNMMNQTNYVHLIGDITSYFEKKIDELRTAGVTDIILDPGFGFAKNLDQNYYLLKNLHYFELFGCPILAGLSRKSMIYRFLESNPENALIGTSVLNTFALQNGASILRVHDVKEAMETIKLQQKVQNVELHSGI